MLQHDNTWPHVARICTQFLEAENIPVLGWPAYSLDMSRIEHVRNALDRFQVLPISSNFAQPLKRSGPTFYRPQSQINHHTCAIIMLSNQDLDMPTPVRWMDFLGKEVLTNKDLDRFVINI